ncbi:MAG: MBL fold metallo-hydrolase [Gammaproteobacteria bacterium]|nr:MBL fold metallo-hydrolase [Gammaproteobacteria bacterium]MDH3970584.1 MBL fold metallo-hydrolase [Gammaproteobacteria bacterium]MDH3986711.1 MBL fold metallo-hydrolase [Gammaproteobacteria bacterium]
MQIRQLFDPESSTFSYLLWDDSTREAALIDPVQTQVHRDVQLVRELRLILKYTLETHVHADHVTGSGLLRQALNSIVMVHENSQTKCADVQIKGGDFIPLGTKRINVINTPGHTDSDISYLIDGAVFTGDSLLIRGCGRTDFQSGDASLLYQSVRQQLFTLPGDTLVYPGHDYQGRCCSTITEEMAHNPRLGLNKSLEEFVDIMSNLKLAPPKHIHEALPSNLRCGVSGKDSAVAVL